MVVGDTYGRTITNHVAEGLAKLKPVNRMIAMDVYLVSCEHKQIGINLIDVVDDILF